MKIIRYKDLARANYEWLDTRYHFSFANYYDPANMGYGNIRVINDDLVKPGTGFDMHPHKNMEIISYMVSGELTHSDSMGNTRKVKAGDIQYMSAGTGVYHSEHNYGNETLRLLQVWILPEKQQLPPAYGDMTFDVIERTNRWLHLVSGKQGDGKVKINQDADMYAADLGAGSELKLQLEGRRGFYVINTEGSSMVNGQELLHGDAAIVEEDIAVTSSSSAHLLVIRTS